MRKLFYALFILIIVACAMREVVAEIPKPKQDGFLGVVYSLIFFGRGRQYHEINYAVAIGSLLGIGILRRSGNWQVQPNYEQLKEKAIEDGTLKVVENGVEAFKTVFPDVKLKGETHA